MVTIEYDADILWTTELTVGCSALDERNQSMLDQLAQATAIIGTADPVSLADWLTGCCEQLDTLLLEEEEELARAGYPELAFHRRLHDQARAMTRDLRSQLQRAPAPAALRLLARAGCDAMARWLPRHVVDADRLFFPYVDQRFRGR